jgi:hypothetical protein
MPDKLNTYVTLMYNNNGSVIQSGIRTWSFWEIEPSVCASVQLSKVSSSTNGLDNKVRNFHVQRQ